VDAVALKNTLKILSLVGMFMATFFTLPILVGLFANEEVSPLIVFDALFFGLSLIGYLLVLKHKVVMRIKDAILSVNLIWLLLGLSGAVPYMLSTHVSFVDGFFEAVSGYTTTGATIYSDIEGLPMHILLLRSLMHWLGGMGIIVLGVGLFSLINPTGSMALFKAEATGNKLEKLSAKIKDTALRIWGVYVLLTVADMLLLWMEGMSLFDAINHAFSTMSTGGFSTKNDSMAHWQYQPVIIWTTTIFMMLAGINFLAHLRALRGDFKGYLTEEVRWYMIIFVALSIALSWYRIDTGNVQPWFVITHSFFSVASILTTTGFASVNYEQWGPAAVVIIFVAMLIGGNAGSTAGGFKVSRYVVLMKNVTFQIRRLLHPKAITALYVDGNRVSHETLGIITGFALIFTATNLIVTFYLYARGYDLMTSLSAALAMVGNIGPGFARVGVVDNYAFFTAPDKIILSIAMILGRLEFYTVIMLFSRTFWKKF
jgi:trk system potassium uptake protein TrkH